MTTWPPDHWKIGGGDRLGLGHLRPGNEPDLLRHGQPRLLEPRASARRQQVVVQASSPATPTPAKRSGPISTTRTTCSITTRSTSTSCSTCRSTGRTSRCGKCSFIRAATATCTSSIARPGRCSRPRRYVRHTARKGVDLKTGRLIPNEEKHPQVGKVDPRHSARLARREGLAAVRLLAATRAGSTFRIRISRATTRRSRPTTSKARRTSA